MKRVLIAIVLWLWPAVLVAQETTLNIATVTRPPFSMMEGDKHTGFSVELWEMVAEELQLETNFVRVGSFGAMLSQVTTGLADGAIANITITAERETVMDFTQPIFDSSLRIMLHNDGTRASIFSSLFTWDVALAVLAAIGLLFGGGMLMWLFERHRQPYFDRPASDAVFPSFWWALNLVVNGGFEERMPQSRPGRVFAVILVVSSLFIVSIFVAQITAATTVRALQSSVNSINDLEGKRVGTIRGSTSATFLQQRDLSFIPFEGLEPMLQSFEENRLDAVFFDGPILSYYVENEAGGAARMLDRDFRPEAFGMALPAGSPLREPINQVLLRLREDGRYEALRTRWFGSRG